jgi:hypothetical protein
VSARAPTVEKTDYAKWMIEDPRINFAISQRDAKPDVDHLGFQVDSDEELRALRSEVAAAQVAAVDQPDAVCCYARSDKYWTTDPQGIAWETYHTLGEAEIYGADSRHKAEPAGCCAPRPQAVGVTLPKAAADRCC